ncbi:GNAT family N-acetyltransferase [Shewanella gaetbuli]|uniref:GNAT family N-acetyltransferase n=1 Tax=Shewanella gaetbuli TaxID=220752 RepID=A0A9X1ZF76_9GAMM|nr:GNAT family N-acetyltransferase [Shewanella gaetbuli]MCL1141264.1 GNAT family N-acetyltransferase [Shewanella gaetbuli]
MINYRLANLADVAPLLVLERTHVNAELAQADPSLQGQALSSAQLTQLINQHWIMLAEDDGKIVGYVIATHWSFFNNQGLYSNILNRLAKLECVHPSSFVNISEINSCQYGPIWIEATYRGTGIFAELVNALYRQLSRHFAFVVAYIADENARSFAAHTKYANMQVMDFFSYQQRDYYLLLKGV